MLTRIVEWLHIPWVFFRFSLVFVSRVSAVSGEENYAVADPWSDTVWGQVPIFFGGIPEAKRGVSKIKLVFFEKDHKLSIHRAKPDAKLRKFERK